MERRIINIDEIELTDSGHGDSFAAKTADIAWAIGSRGLGCTLHIVEPGKKAYPLHNHHREHEMFVILEGTGTYRLGTDRLPLRSGDVIAAPTGGPETAHQIINTGTTTLKYLGFSNIVDTEVVEYPESGKIGVQSRPEGSSGPGGVSHRFRQTDNSIDYWEGES